MYISTLIRHSGFFLLDWKLMCVCLRAIQLQDAERLGPSGANSHVNEVLVTALLNSNRYDIAEKYRARTATFRGHV